MEETQEYSFNIDRHLDELEQITDSDTDSETGEEQCESESKAGFQDLPNGKTFLYSMNQGKGLKKKAKKVWKNPKAKKKVIRMLERFDNEDSDIQEKPIKSLTSITEIKNSGSGPRVFVYRGKNQKPIVVGFCMRDELNPTVVKLKRKFN